MKYISKNHLAEDNIKKFGEKFYKQKVSLLFKQGTKGLNPLDTIKLTEQEEIIVQTQEIIQFFQEQVQADGSLPGTDIYFSNLYTLFAILSKGAEAFSFESASSISEKDIQEADNKKTIESLTMNLIITYFNNIKLPSGQVDKDFLSLDLNRIIVESNTGRDYKTLVGNTLNNLSQTLQTDKSWRDCFQHINEASLICQLVGSRLPQIDESALENIISKANKEIKALLVMLIKILSTKDKAVEEQFADKKYLKLMDKLDSAIRSVLEKLDNCLLHSLKFMKTTSMLTGDFFGDLDNVLKQCLNKILTAGHVEQNNSDESSLTLNHTMIRHRLRMFFNFDNIVLYFSSFQKDKNYQQICQSFHQSYFNEIIKEIIKLRTSRDNINMRVISTCLSETIVLLERLKLNKQSLDQEKKDIQKRYISLLRQTSFDNLDTLMEIRSDIGLIIQNNSKELMGTIQIILLENCFTSLSNISLELPNNEVQREILKILFGYANYYKPMREFYHKFFSKYVGPEETPSMYLTELVKNNPKVALSLLVFFSDPKFVSDLLTRKQIKASEALLNIVKEQIR